MKSENTIIYQPISILSLFLNSHKQRLATAYCTGIYIVHLVFGYCSTCTHWNIFHKASKIKNVVPTPHTSRQRQNHDDKIQYTTQPIIEWMVFHLQIVDRFCCCCFCLVFVEVWMDHRSVVWMEPTITIIKWWILGSFDREWHHSYYYNITRHKENTPKWQTKVRTYRTVVASNNMWKRVQYDFERLIRMLNHIPYPIEWQILYCSRIINYKGSTSISFSAQQKRDPTTSDIYTMTVEAQITQTRISISQ